MPVATAEAVAIATEKSKRKVSFLNKKKMDPDAERDVMPARRCKNQQFNSDIPFVIGADPGPANFAAFEQILIFLSYLIIAVFFPFSLFFVLKTTQEYEYIYI